MPVHVINLEMDTRAQEEQEPFWSPAHEHIKVERNAGTVGIADFTQSTLGDATFVDLLEAGDYFDRVIRLAVSSQWKLHLMSMVLRLVKW